MRRTSIATLTAGLTLCAQLAAAEPVVYPNRGQSEQQQEKDKFECHEWSTKETGVDPVALAEQQPAAQPSEKGGMGAGASAGMGAMRGAAQGDAAAGAARGFGIGRLVAMARARRQLKEQQESASEQSADVRAKLATYDKAYGTCLTGRGYTVSQP